MNMGCFDCDFSWCSVVFETLWNLVLVKQRVEASAAFILSPLRLSDATR